MALRVGSPPTDAENGGHLWTSGKTSGTMVICIPCEHRRRSVSASASLMNDSSGKNTVTLIQTVRQQSFRLAVKGRLATHVLLSEAEIKDPALREELLSAHEYFGRLVVMHAEPKRF
jgi:hypothetical protein